MSTIERLEAERERLVGEKKQLELQMTETGKDALLAEQLKVRDRCKHLPREQSVEAWMKRKAEIEERRANLRRLLSALDIRLMAIRNELKRENAAADRTKVRAPSFGKSIERTTSEILEEILSVLKAISAKLSAMSRD